MTSTTAVSETKTSDSAGAAIVVSGPSNPIHQRIAASPIAPVAIALKIKYRTMSTPHGFSCGTS